MKSNTALSGPMAVLSLPKSPKELLTVGKAVHDAMANNPSFPSPNPPLNVFKAKLTALDEAETKAAARTWGAAMARDAIKKEVVNDLYHLRDYVQGVAEKIPLPETAAAVIMTAQPARPAMTLAWRRGPACGGHRDRFLSRPTFIVPTDAFFVFVEPPARSSFLGKALASLAEPSATHSARHLRAMAALSACNVT